MKIEKRGKYPGVKVHLDPAECEKLMEFAKDIQVAFLTGNTSSNKLEVELPALDQTSFFSISYKIGKQMNKLISKDPDFLKERTPEQVKESLLKDKEKIEKQLAAGAGWKQVE